METNSKKTTLIILFTHIGNTENVGRVKEGNNAFIAHHIANYMNADIFRLEDPTEYPDSLIAMKRFVRNMQYAKRRPRSLHNNPDLNPYDKIFLIYPIWNKDIPLIFYSFLEKNDFAGKTVIPLCSQESSGICGTYEKIKSLLIEANVIVTDFCMKGTEARKPAAQKTIEDWLKSLGY